MNKFKSRYERWNKWRKRNLNGSIYKVLVLIGLQRSPTFELMPVIEAATKSFNEGVKEAINDT